MSTHKSTAHSAFSLLLDRNDKSRGSDWPGFSLGSETFDQLLPEVFCIETAVACNLRCPECAIGGGLITRGKGFLSFERFRIAAERIERFCQYLYLHIWGEPMLNREIIPMIRHASQFARTNISTNGLTLTPELAEELIISGVADIIVSIDGVTQEIYEQYRVGGDVKEAFVALEMLQEFNRKHGGKVQISPQFVVFEHNQHEMAAFEKRCKALGLLPSFKAPYIRTHKSRFAYSSHPQFLRPHYPDIPSLREAMRECPNVRNVFTILMDGSVVACCHDYAKATCFGNIFEQEVLNIWNSHTYRKFRQNVIAGRAPKFCIDGCMSYFLNQPADSSENPPEAKETMFSEAQPATDLTALKKVNLCSGPRRLEGYLNIDVVPGADMQVDLERQLLPLADNSVDALVCMSAINYFSRSRALEITRDVHRVLKPGGIARFGSQDLRILAEKYLQRDHNFYSEKLPDGRDRFPGKTIADKFNEFFYGFRSGDKHCKYVYDLESLMEVFFEAGFTVVEPMHYRQSRLPDVDQIDNRPEQMFFLEAEKGQTPEAVDLESAKGVPAAGGTSEAASAPSSGGTGATMFRLAVQIWKAGERERGWQYLLKALEIDPTDKIAVALCSKILAEHRRFDDQAKLYRAYLESKPDDADVRSALEQNLATPRQAKDDLDAATRKRMTLEAINSRINPILSDRDHLAACMRWLRRAQEANPGGGVSALYYLDSQRWDVDYPETTGYIIPTFLVYARLTHDEDYRNRAKSMGDWEIAIQSPEGGAGEPVGVYGLRPRIFNTGQVILGWVALYRETGDRQYLMAARRAADWIVGNLDAEGIWRRSTYAGPRAYKSRVAWALLELYAISGIEKYREGAERVLGWILAQAHENGWFENNSLSDPHRPWTHLIGYVLVGLLEILRLNNACFDQRKVLHLLHNAAKGMKGHYLREKARAANHYVTLAATFDQDWESSDAWTCVTGTAQVEFFLRRLALHVDDSSLIEAADMLLDDLKRIQLRDDIDDANAPGGLPGAMPVGAGYCVYSIPNWGVKFFADSLLQRLVPVEQQLLIG
jgi:MoaA/NifB/PqqE/SkfB family radical SAM enzyme/predicted SAM-dependent methyltransferase